MKIFLILALLATAVSSSAHATKCSLLVQAMNGSAELASVDELFSALPAVGSSKRTQFLDSIRLHMDPIKGEGWVILNLKEYLPEPTFDRFFSICPAGTICMHDSFFGDGVYFVSNEGTSSIAEKTKISLNKLNDWIQEVIKEALPHEFQKANNAEYRILSGGIGTKLELWHPDGEQINATLALKGRGTEIMPKGSQGVAKETKQGELFIFSGQERMKTLSVPPTIHRTPPGETNRLLFLLRI